MRQAANLLRKSVLSENARRFLQMEKAGQLGRLGLGAVRHGASTNRILGSSERFEQFEGIHEEGAL